MPTPDDLYVYFHDLMFSSFKVLKMNCSYYLPQSTNAFSHHVGPLFNVTSIGKSKCLTHNVRNRYPLVNNKSHDMEVCNRPWSKDV